MVWVTPQKVRNLAALLYATPSNQSTKMLESPSDGLNCCNVIDQTRFFSQTPPVNSPPLWLVIQRWMREERNALGSHTVIKFASLWQIPKNIRFCVCVPTVHNTTIFDMRYFNYRILLYRTPVITTQLKFCFSVSKFFSVTYFSS